ncbi:MAG: hypothetical protein JWL75_72 [Parcubacteria group bacterium]|nr:hypothetical protein [Parcubacteria group bacterium]
MTQTLTQFLIERGLDPSVFAPIVSALGDKTESRYGFFDTYCSSYLMDVLPHEGGLLVLYGTSMYSTAGGGIQKGWKTAFVEKGGQRTELDSCIWRDQFNPSKDRPMLDYTKILGVEEEGDKLRLKLGAG